MRRRCGSGVSHASAAENGGGTCGAEVGGACGVDVGAGVCGLEVAESALVR